MRNSSRSGRAAGRWLLVPLLALLCPPAFGVVYDVTKTADTNDGVCDAQMWAIAELNCTVSIEETSWSTIKGLYR